MSIKLEDIKDPRLRSRLVAAMIEAGELKREITVEFGQPEKLKKPEPRRLKQNHKPKMNVLETEYFARIKDRYPNYPPVRNHAKTFVLANGVRYTPDFSCSIWPRLRATENDAGPSRETCWEVKGKHAWEDSIVKAKVAAHEWPEIQWIFAWKQDGGEWQEQVILP